jgi:2-polyprenyl-3-methyl-5-hydroxy-6-metoxy-1,4-benzoquinol methylase
MNANGLEHCPVCGSREIAGFLEIAQVPVYCNVLWPTRREALAAPQGNLALASCNACGHVFNRRFDPGLVDYSVEYENSLHYSPRFQQYAEKLARDLIHRHDLHGKTVLEIACGKGDFLGLLCELGDNRGYGFDPSYEPGRDKEDGTATGAAKIEFVQDYYGPDYAGYEADFVCCRHALEHIPQATEFLRDLRTSLGDRHETVVFFEVPNSLYSLRDLGIWDFIYEHPSYFCAESLTRAFVLAGFTVLDVQEVYGGQFLTIEAKPRPGGDNDAGEPAGQETTTAGAEAVAGYVRALPARYQELVASWRSRLDELAAVGRQAAVWGGGSKGVTFLNILRARDEVSCVVDINPHKQGGHVPGTGQQVVAPEHLRDDRPALIIVMNPLYREEIGGMVADLGIDADIVGV